jgi:hypothetical protein
MDIKIRLQINTQIFQVVGPNPNLKVHHQIVSQFFIIQI